MSTTTAATGADTIEVLDEVSRVVMIFRSAADAELYGLTGEMTWVDSRVPGPGDVPALTFADLARGL